MAIVEQKPVFCPYCESKFENKEDLSSHIDRIHHSSDLIRAILGHSKFNP